MIQALWLVLVLLVLLVAIPLVYAIGCYNRLVRGRNLCRNGFSQIDVQLKRRHDLIPNLVETAKAYMSHERETLEAVIAARNQAEGARDRLAADATDSSGLRELATAERGLGGALGRLFALSEAYPELKANTTMASLTEELTTTENKISFARQAYNDSVMSYNNTREQFPSNLVAGAFRFEAATSFEIEEPVERAPVRVAF